MKEQNYIDCYEREFYVFSNFSSFQLEWKGHLWPTSEHAYQAEKFEEGPIKEQIKAAKSAHDAYKIAQANQGQRKKNWNEIKLGVMKSILIEKVKQHPYVLKKLIESQGRDIIECSWRDDFWGWGPNKDGENWLGKLWMQIREKYVHGDIIN